MGCSRLSGKGDRKWSRRGRLRSDQEEAWIHKLRILSKFHSTCVGANEGIKQEVIGSESPLSQDVPMNHHLFILYLKD